MTTENWSRKSKSYCKKCTKQSERETGIYDLKYSAL